MPTRIPDDATALTNAGLNADPDASTDEVGSVVGSCHSPKTFTFYLEDENGAPIPEAAYEITLADLSTRTGELDREGKAVIEDCPDGPYEIHYTDLDDIKAKSLAARAHQACQNGDVDEIHNVLCYSPELLQSAASAYSEYFNDLSGNGLAEDVQNAVTEEGLKLLIQILLTRGGLSAQKTIVLTKFDEGEGDPAPYLDFPPPPSAEES